MEEMLRPETEVTECYLQLRLHSWPWPCGWPGMLFQNSRGFSNYGKHPPFLTEDFCHVRPIL